MSWLRVGAVGLLAAAASWFDGRAHPADAGGLERGERRSVARPSRPKPTADIVGPAPGEIVVVRRPVYMPDLSARIRATAADAEREVQAAAAAAGYPADRPAVVDERVERLMEGARRAWESIGQPPQGMPRDTPFTPPPTRPAQPLSEPQRTDPPRTGPPAPPRTAAADADRGLPLDALQRLFRRPPDAVSPRPPDARADLGRRLFSEAKLSADHRMSCATCHDPAKSLQDDRARARGNKGEALQRNTPSLWNAGFAKRFYWDGRAATLEAQVKDAVEREGEMDATLEAAVVWLARDPSYLGAFSRAFAPAPSPITPTRVAEALAAYQHTLISPATRFDRWIQGDAAALDAAEVAGFRIFAGKGRCLACHGGWRFTDDDFHDTGLRSPDRGRAAVPGVTSAEHAFKTPSLREVRWSAPYMHDGSLRTLEDVVAHYAGRLEQRPSLAAELRAGIALTAAERNDLVAFLKAISSDKRPEPPR
jgi:cytochrome c peroxidase